MQSDEEKRRRLEQLLEEQHKYRAEYQEIISHETDPLRQGAAKLSLGNVEKRIQELEQELTTLPPPATERYFRRNYVNLIDSEAELIGRENELKELDRMLEGWACLAIRAVGGQGKTALAYAYLKPYLTPNPQRPTPNPFSFLVWQTIEGNGSDLNGLAEKLGVKAASNPKETTESVLEYLLSHPVLVVLDNFESAIKPDGSLPLDVEALLKRIAEFRGKSRIIITTRELPKGYRLKSLALDGLTPEAGADLLAERGLSGEPRSQLLEAARKARGHPFALKLLADLLVDSGAGDTLADLLRQGDFWDRELSNRLLRKTWDERLNEDERRLLQILAVLRPPVRRQTLLGMLSEKDEFHLRQLLNSLYDKSLLTQERDPKDPAKLRGFDLHPLLRRFVLNEKLSSEEVTTLHRAATAYFKSLFPTLPPKEIYGRKSVEDVWPILEAVYHLNETDGLEAATALFFEEKLNYDLFRWGESSLSVEIYQGWLTVPEITNRLKGGLLHDLGSAYLRLGQIKKATQFYEQALTIASGTDDKHIENLSLGNLGFIYICLDQNQRAIDYLQQALRITREINDERLESRHLDSLGIAYRNLGEIEQARQYHQQALDISREIGDKQGEGIALSNVAISYEVLGQLEQAIEYYQQALAISREIGERSTESNRLGNLGLAYFDLGQTQKAIEHYQQALTLYRGSGDKRGAAYVLNNFGYTYEKMDNLAKALAYWRVALAIFTALGYPQAKLSQEYIDGLKEQQGEEAFNRLWVESEEEYQRLKREYD